jgi:hypothetical protein
MDLRLTCLGQKHRLCPECGLNHKENNRIVGTCKRRSPTKYGVPWESHQRSQDRTPVTNNKGKKENNTRKTNIPRGKKPDNPNEKQTRKMNEDIKKKEKTENQVTSEIETRKFTRKNSAARREERAGEESENSSTT